MHDACLNINRTPFLLTPLSLLPDWLTVTSHYYYLLLSVYCTFCFVDICGININFLFVHVFHFLISNLFYSMLVLVACCLFVVLHEILSSWRVFSFMKTDFSVSAKLNLVVELLLWIHTSGLVDYLYQLWHVCSVLHWRKTDTEMKIIFCLLCWSCCSDVQVCTVCCVVAGKTLVIMNQKKHCSNWC